MSAEAAIRIHQHGGVAPNNVSAEVGSGGFIHVVGVGNDSELYVNAFSTDGTWSGWTAVSGATVTGVPAIIQDAAGNVRVYVRRVSDGSLLENDIAAGTSTWTGFTVLTGGTWINDPVAWGGSGGTVWVFEIGSGTFINYDKLPSGGTAYSGWTGIASGFVGVPGIVQDTGGSDHLFAREQRHPRGRHAPRRHVGVAVVHFPRRPHRGELNPNPCQGKPHCRLGH